MNSKTWTLTSPNAEADARALETDGVDRHDDPTPRQLPRTVFAAGMVSLAERQPTFAVILVAGKYTYVSVNSPFRVLDVFAGYGCWASEFARHWVVVLGLPREWLHITGVEVFEARERHLDKWCDEWALDDWREALNAWVFGGLSHSRWDLIMGNPAFHHVLRSGLVWSATANKGAGGMVKTPYRKDPETTLVPTLRQHARAVLLLHHCGAFADSEYGREVYRKHRPAREWKAGRIGFRGDGKTDNRPYLVTLWTDDHEGPCASEPLDEFERQWTVPPGSEDPSEDLPSAPGWSP